MQVLWVSDPVHGNTIKTESGYKTRRMEDIRSELRTFFDVHQRMGTHAGGVSMERGGGGGCCIHGTPETPGRRPRGIISPGRKEDARM